MKHAHQRMTVGVTTKEVGKEGAKAEVVRLSGLSLAKKSRPSKEDDDLDGLWDDVGVGVVLERTEASEEENDADADQGHPEKRRRKQPASTATPRKRGTPGGAGCGDPRMLPPPTRAGGSLGVAPLVGFTLTRIQRELSTTEVVVLQCAQLKRSMSNNYLCLTVAVKAVDSLILKAQNRLVVQVLSGSLCSGGLLHSSGSDMLGALPKCLEGFVAAPAVGCSVASEAQHGVLRHPLVAGRPLRS